MKEFSIIQKKKFCSYFLIIYFISIFCHKRGILIGPRGSAAGALTTYLLGITNIDPLEYDLLFERFLNESRPDFPDYDLDVPSPQRQDVIDFLSK
jgi:DNA polymerase-3 subunit alpha